MARPKCCKKITGVPRVIIFKPDGVPGSELEEVILNLDELEAVKLADHNGMYQENAAFEMCISRQTFGRLIDSAHKKIADALLNGKSIKIDGGKVELASGVKEECDICRHRIDNTECGRLSECPYCERKKNTIYKGDSK